MKKTSYMASYDTESIRCLDGLRTILAHHRELDIPATVFVTGELLEDESWAAEFRRLTDSPLFEIGNHTYTHLSLVTGPERSDWDREILEEEVDRTNRQIERVTDRKPAGFRTPCGFSEGLRGEREILLVLWQAGIRYVSSRLMGENGTLPAPLTEPFWYDREDILRPLMELPTQGWHDNILKGYNPCPVAWPPPFPWGYPAALPRTPEEAFSVFRQELDLACGKKMTYYAPIFHPWAVNRFSSNAGEVRLLLEYVKDQEIPTCNYSQMYTRLAEERPI